uniref:THAP-type domain-containing protein n=1 Tax=Sparus aurata TaxID=8175 RepID=A0A671U4D6_SPAAU
MSVFKIKEKRLTYQRQEKKTSLHCCVFHRFPIDPEVRAQWLIKIRRGNFSPTLNTRLSSWNFQTGDFAVTAGGQRRLNKGAVPSLFAWNDYTVPAPRLNVWDRRPRCPSPGIAASDSDSKMEVPVAAEHGYCVTLMVTSDELACENEALQKNMLIDHRTGNDFDASVKVPLHPIENQLARKRNYGKSQKCLFRRNYAFTRRFNSYSNTTKASVAFGREFHFKRGFIVLTDLP